MNAPRPDATPATPGPDALLDAQRRAHRDQPRSVKDDAVDDKLLQVEPDGTGPTPTESFDPEEDRHAGSGNGGPSG